MLPGKKSCKPIEVNGEKYLCSIWYSDEEKIWCGQAFETSHFPPVCRGETREELMEKLILQMNKDLRTT